MGCKYMQQMINGQVYVTEEIPTDKEKFDFLFVDMEWNQKAGTSDLVDREPIQIGLIGTDANLEKRKLFSKSIRLDDASTLTEETCKLTHVNKNVIMQANSLAEVFKRIEMSFPKFETMVVWTQDTYDLFMQSAKISGIKIPEHKVIILQDMIYPNKKRKIGFETALKRGNIPYEKSYLHYSKHDVQYLYEIYKRVEEGCQFSIKNEAKVKKTNLTPMPKKKEITKLTPEPKKKETLGSVYNFWESEYRNLPLTEENILRICNRYNMKCNFSDGIVFLTTNCGYWRIYLNGDKVDRVFHGNYEIRMQEHKKKKKCNEGFHLQHISHTNFYDTLKYIYYHDKDLYGKRKKTRVEILLEQLEKERLEKIVE